MIERYTLPEMAALWNEEAKFRAWLRVELAVCRARAFLGEVPAEEVEELAEKPYGSVKPDDVSMRVIADHMRASVFLLCDGVRPENTGRGYVLRRIIRRAARHGKMLGFEEPFLYRLVDAVQRVMGSAYPELEAQSEYVSKMLLGEEERELLELIERLDFREIEMRGQTAKRTVRHFGLDYDYEALHISTDLMLNATLRAKKLDEVASGFLARHPNAVGLDLGAGLDILGCAVTGAGDVVAASRADEPELLSDPQ